MAGVAIELLLIRQRLHLRRIKPRPHPTQPDPYIIRQMAALLGTGSIGRLEPVRRAGMTGQTFYVLQSRGIRLQVGSVAGGGGDPLPGLLGIALDVAPLADLPWHLGMRRNAVRARRDPVVQLPALGLELERMAGMAGETIVRAFELVDQEIGPGVRANEELAAGHEDVAAGAKIVVMHDVVMGLYAAAHDEQQDRSHGGTERELHSAVARDQPTADPSASPPE